MHAVFVPNPPEDTFTKEMHTISQPIISQFHRVASALTVSNRAGDAGNRSGKSVGRDNKPLPVHPTRSRQSSVVSNSSPISIRRSGITHHLTLLTQSIHPFNTQRLYTLSTLCLNIS